MHALTLTQLKTPLVLEERPAVACGPGQVVVRVKAAALNRRDYWITQGLYPGVNPPVVLGSDASGIVDRAGDERGESWIGRSVILDPGLNWGDQAAAQSSQFTILGVPHDGTFATEVAVELSQLHDQPPHLDCNQAAALPLAGVTAYRAVFTQGGLQPGETVLITGIGGGVAVFALQFAVAAGADVWVTSSSPQKISRAVELGASGGFDYTDAEWTNQYSAAADSPALIIDGAGGPGYGDLIQLAAPGGRIVSYGATAGPPQKLALAKVFWKQLRLQGSTMGSPDDFTRMVQFVNQHQVKPIVDSITPLQDGNEALSAMEASPQFGKFVLSMESAD